MVFCLVVVVCLIAPATTSYAQDMKKGTGKDSAAGLWKNESGGGGSGNAGVGSGKDPFGDVSNPFGNKQGLQEKENNPWKNESAGAPWGEGAAESKFTFGGRVKNKFSMDTQDDNKFEDLYQNHVQFELDGTYKPSQAVELKIGAGADYYTYGRNSDWSDEGNLRLFDAYVNLAGKGYNLKVGNQIVRWGKSDGFSPLDNVNPEDYRGGIGGRREDRKLQIPMVNLEVYPGNFTLQGIYIPIFVKSKYDYNGTDWAMFDHYEAEVGSVDITEEDPDNGFENSEGGVRLSSTAGKVDYAFSYLYTHEKVGTLGSLYVPPGFTPVFGSHVIKDLVRYAHATNQPIHLLHDRQNIYGVSFETTLSVLGIRGDVAYTDKVSYITKQLQRVRKPVVQYMVGADYNGPASFYLNVQFGQTYIRNYDDDILLADELSSNINGTISKGFYDDNLKLAFRWYYDFAGHGTLYNPKCILNYWQNVTLELGVEVFNGTDANPLGYYRDNDQAYMSVELHF